MTLKQSCLVAIAAFAVAPPSVRVIIAAPQHEAGAHTHAAAASIKNPVTPDETSIAAGKQVFARHCASCHGASGAGDGVQAAKFTPKPSNLADAEWKHGPTDGEMFTVIKNGVPKTAMAGFAKKMTDREMWEVVNFVRSVGPKTHSDHAH